MTPKDDSDSTVYCSALRPVSEEMAASVSRDSVFNELRVDLASWIELDCAIETGGPVVLRLAGPALEISGNDALELGDIRDIGMELPEFGDDTEPVRRYFITDWDMTVSPPKGSFRLPAESEDSRALVASLSDVAGFQRAFKYATRAPLRALGNPDACLVWNISEQTGFSLTGSSRDPNGCWYSAASARLAPDKVQVLSEHDPIFTRITGVGGGRVPHGCVALEVETVPTAVRVVPLGQGNRQLGGQEYARMPSGEEWDAVQIIDDTIATGEHSGLSVARRGEAQLGQGQLQFIELLKSLWPDTTAWQRGWIQTEIESGSMSFGNLDAGTHVTVPLAQQSIRGSLRMPGPVAYQLLEALAEDSVEIKLQWADERAFQLTREHGDCYWFQAATNFT